MKRRYQAPQVIVLIGEKHKSIEMINYFSKVDV